MEKENKIKQYAPVAIVTCNRYSHLKDCVESLVKCTYAQDTEVYISVDYPPSDEYVQGWKEVKEYVHSIQGFKKVNIWIQDYNLGLYGNSDFVHDRAFEKYEYLIFTEDDNTFAPAFLDYMNKMLQRFEKDPKVFSIAGFSMLRPNYSSKIYKCHTFQPWGEGTWRDKWKRLCDLDKPEILEHYSKKCFKIAKIYFENKWVFCAYMSYLIGGSNEMPMSDLVLSIIFYLFGYYTIYPTRSLVKNNGFDGTGLTCRVGAIPHIEDLELGLEPLFIYDESIKVPISKELQFPVPEWVKRSSKFKQDPLTYILYFIMGKERYRKWKESRN